MTDRFDSPTFAWPRPRPWRSAALAAATVAAAAAAAHAQTNLAPVSVTKLPASAPLGKYTGRILAADGDWLAAGNPQGAPGTVFIYHQSGGAWLFHQELHASDEGMPGAAESFGASLAIEGDTLVVGGWREHLQCIGAMCFPLDTDGGAYVFNLDDTGGALTWVETAQLVPDAPVVVSDYNYGASVSISSGLISVGARSADHTPGPDMGAVFVFDGDGAGGWDHITTIDEPVGADDYFGHALAQDGGTLVVGSPHVAGGNDGTAAIYQIDRVAQTASLVQEIPSLSFGSAEEYGGDVDIDGDYLVVGSNTEDSSVAPGTGRAYVWKRDPGTGVWAIDAVLEASDGETHDVFADAVAIRGRTVLAGCWRDDAMDVDSGSVYPFFRSGDTWVEGNPIVNVAADGNWLSDHLGVGLALDDDGLGFFAGADNDDEYGQWVGSVARVELDYACYGVLATITGTNGPDVLTGGPGMDIIVALEGDDVVRGLGGTDLICGGGGADYLAGGDDGDFVFGEDGDDHIYGEGGSDFLYGGDGVDSMDGGDLGDLMWGGDGNDDMIGGPGSDEMSGEGGDDLMHGNDGSDEMSGGDGDDTMWGDAGDDTIDGDDGDDWISGGLGSNTCDGGADTDIGYWCQVKINFP